MACASVPAFAWRSVTTALDALLGGLYPSAEKVARRQRLESNPRVDFHQLDLREADLSALPSSITHVIHEAAMPGLGLSWNDFALYESCNLSATARLIEAAAEWPLERFIQISTSSVYGKTAAGDETLALAPASPHRAMRGLEQESRRQPQSCHRPTK